MKQLKYKVVECEGYKFRIGPGDCYAPVFMIQVDGKWLGCYLTQNVGDELDWRSGVYATEELLKAITAARKFIPQGRVYG
jgi:hypothetical protein